MSIIPKPTFKSCDETSLTLKWDNFLKEENSDIKIQYRELDLDWDNALEFVVTPDSDNEISIQAVDLVDLNPGTPYFVRLVVVDRSTGNINIGPETGRI